MKTLIATAALAAAAFASPALAQESKVEIKDAVARVAVIVENRSDIAVEIEQGSSGLPAMRVSRRDGRIWIDGDVDGRNRIQRCESNAASSRPGEGAWVEVRGLGRINMSDAPLIVIRTPADVDLSSNGAVFGSVGRGARSVELGVAGCGDWDVANTNGPLSLSIGGSGDIHAGTSRDLEISIGGSGSVQAGSTGSLEVAIGGSGDVDVASINGPMEVSIGGSGDVAVRRGSAPTVEVSIAGSGDVRFDGTAGDVEAAIVGGGDITIARATGHVSRTIMGGGDIRIGG